MRKVYWPKRIARPMTRFYLKAFCVVFSFLIIGNTYADTLQYTIVDLGTLGGLYSTVNDINASGQAVGYSQLVTPPPAICCSTYIPPGPPVHAALWSNTGVATDKGDSGHNTDFNTAIATGINDSGVIVGYTIFGDQYSNSSQAIRWNVDGSRTILSNDLGRLGLANWAEADAINSKSQIVGSATVGNYGPTYSVIWNPKGKPSILQKYKNNNSFVSGINNSGVIVGSTQIITDEGLIVRAVFWNKQRKIKLLSSINGGGNSFANDINNKNIIVGYNEMPPVSNGNSWIIGTHAVMWKNNKLIDLGCLNNGVYSSCVAQGINDHNQIVGSSSAGDGSNYGVGHAFIFDEKYGGMLDLNNLAINLTSSGFVTLESAQAINNNGQIIGAGKTTNGLSHAFLATPTFNGN